MKAAARRKYTPEENIRIVLEGFRREVTVNDLCRREGIKPHSYYSWTKEFMEVGKERLTRDSVRDATQHEVGQLKRENGELKELVADLSLEAYRLKKTAIPMPQDAKTNKDLRTDQEAISHHGTVLLFRKNAQSCYQPGRCRQLAAWTTDNQGFSVSESTVYRILRREGLVKRAEMQLAAGKEYHWKTTGPHQMWATDASYFRVVGWGYYYMVTVMDDYSRFILAHRLQRDMTSDSFIEVVQEAVDRTGMDQIPITDRTKLLSDNGPGYVSRAFRDYLGMVGIKHILATPFHPQTNGKLERYHQTLKRDVNQLPYEMPSDLEAAIVAFVSYYNYRRYHKALGNVTPSDVLKGRREEILRRRKEVQAQTIQRRRQHNRAIRELTRPQSDP